MAFLPATYFWGNRTIIIDSDRSIDVQAGDSLSAYSMAMYGDFKPIDACSSRHW